jgi:hypothetical protein
MTESMAQAEVRTLRVPEAGVLVTIVTSSSNLIEKSAASGFDVVKMVRGELFRSAAAGIDWLEAMHHSAFKIVRETIRRLDVLSGDSVEGVESVTTAVICAIRGSSEAVGGLASTAAETLLGKRSSATKAA